ncbi:uncharacterized protein LOC141855924 [Brevipalpus obovatus]|uniref:uncharacterized protein LOC141855924 n=1 Tax=Brevipalpus obovatus TaxID=246614 RepID=UPI003D9F2C0C
MGQVICVSLMFLFVIVSVTFNATSCARLDCDFSDGKRQDCSWKISEPSGISAANKPSIGPESPKNNEFLLFRADKSSSEESLEKDLILTKLEIPKIILDTPDQISLCNLAVQMLNSQRLARQQLSDGEDELYSTDGNNQRIYKASPFNINMNVKAKRQSSRPVVTIDPGRPYRTHNALECCPSISEIIQPLGGVSRHGRILQLYHTNTSRQSFFQTSCKKRDQYCQLIHPTLRPYSRCVQKYSYQYAIVKDYGAPKSQPWRLDYVRVRSGCSCEIRKSRPFKQKYRETSNNVDE